MLAEAHTAVSISVVPITHASTALDKSAALPIYIVPITHATTIAAIFGSFIAPAS